MEHHSIYKEQKYQGDDLYLAKVLANLSLMIFSTLVYFCFVILLVTSLSPHSWSSSDGIIYTLHGRGSKCESNLFNRESQFHQSVPAFLRDLSLRRGGEVLVSMRTRWMLAPGQIHYVNRQLDHLNRQVAKSYDLNGWAQVFLHTQEVELRLIANADEIVLFLAEVAEQGWRLLSSELTYIVGSENSDLETWRRTFGDVHRLGDYLANLVGLPNIVFVQQSVNTQSDSETESPSTVEELISWVEHNINEKYRHNILFTEHGARSYAELSHEGSLRPIQQKFLQVISGLAENPSMPWLHSKVYAKDTAFKRLLVRRARGRKVFESYVDAGGECYRLWWYYQERDTVEEHESLIARPDVHHQRALHQSSEGSDIAVLLLAKHPDDALSKSSGAY